MADLPPLPSIPDFDLRPTNHGRLLVFFPYHPDTVERIKSIAGRRWHPEKRCWSIPYTSAALNRLTTLFVKTPPKVFAQPERRPSAVTQRRWDTLSDEEQVDEAIDHGFDGMIVYVDEAGKPSAFYTGGWKDREKNTYRPGIII